MSFQQKDVGRGLKLNLAEGHLNRVNYSSRRREECGRGEEEAERMNVIWNPR